MNQEPQTHVRYKLLTALTDMIFPPTPEEEFLRNVSDDKIISLYSPCDHEGIQYLSNYNEHIIKTAITQNKFYKNRHASKILGSLLEMWLKKCKAKEVVFIPIPLGRKRQKIRGYNQVLSILEKTSGNFVVNQKLLTRHHETKPQTGLARNDRFKNVQKAFSCREKTINANSETLFVILDDVLTTGATLKAAQSTLKPNLPMNTKLICLAMAH